MKPLSVGLTGASGRMGKVIEELLINDKSFSYTYGIDRTRKIGPALNYSSKIILTEAKKIDVWVDFSSPEFLLENLDKFLDMKIPLVSGTTGLTAAQKKKFFLLGRKLPLLWAPNMSLGMAYFKKMIRAMGPAEHEVVIEEIHHKHKKDKPSGTALELESVLKASGFKNILPTVSIRGGSALGTHRVYNFLEEEQITLEHVAQSRTVFAKGALFAAQWLVKQSPGVYTMDDLIGS